MPTPIQITTQKFVEVASFMRRIAAGAIVVEFHSNAFWVYGSELSTLRLKQAYNAAPVEVGYSYNLATFYFKLSTPNIAGEVRFPRKIRTPAQLLKIEEANRMLAELVDDLENGRASLADFPPELVERLRAAFNP